MIQVKQGCQGQLLSVAPASQEEMSLACLLLVFIRIIHPQVHCPRRDASKPFPFKEIVAWHLKAGHSY